MTRSIKINPMLNGWHVRVGCQNVVFTDLDKMLGELREYFKNPAGTEARYLKDAVNHPGEDYRLDMTTTAHASDVPPAVGLCVGGVAAAGRP